MKKEWNYLRKIKHKVPCWWLLINVENWLTRFLKFYLKMIRILSLSFPKNLNAFMKSLEELTGGKIKDKGHV